MATVAQEAVTGALAEFAASLDWEQVPGPARSAALGAVARTITDATAGTGLRATDRVAQTLADLGLTGAVRVPGRADRFAPFAAALLTGFAASAAGRDRAGPEVATVSAAVVAAQSAGTPGPVLLAAVAAGTELARRLGAGLGSSHPGRGWDVAGTLGVVGAAVAVGRIAGLDACRMVQAIAVATTQASGHLRQHGSQAAALHAGRAAADGVEAGLLAATGFTGPTRPIEGARGMAALMSAGLDHEAVLDGLGVRWRCADGTCRGRPPGGFTPRMRVAMSALVDGAPADALFDTTSGGGR